jgi:hypothetical protein
MAQSFDADILMDNPLTRWQSSGKALTASQISGIVAD